MLCWHNCQVTLSSKRVVRFGSSWTQKSWQQSPCSQTIPEGTQLLGAWSSPSAAALWLMPPLSLILPDATNSAGLHGTVGDDGALSSLGIYFARPGALSAPTQPQQPYNAAQDAVSLTFLRRFYDQHVAPLDGMKGGHPTTTDAVAKTIIMRHTWDTGAGAGRGRARRYAEILEPKQLWPGPESGTDMCVPAKSIASDSQPACLLDPPGIDSFPQVLHQPCVWQPVPSATGCFGAPLPRRWCHV